MATRRPALPTTCAQKSGADPAATVCAEAASETVNAPGVVNLGSVEWLAAVRKLLSRFGLSSEGMGAIKLPTDVPDAYSRAEFASDQPIEVRRYWDALRRSKLLIAFIVVPMTALVLVLSLGLPKTYQANARIVLEDVPGLLDPGTAVERRLATLRTLVTTRSVLRGAGRRLQGENADSLEDKVRASVDHDANLISVVATDDSAQGAALIANAVASEFLARRRRGERDRLARTRERLLQEERSLRDTPGNRLGMELLRERLSALIEQEAGVGSELQLAQAARAPSDPSAPKPVRNTVFAFFASIFLGALFALARGQLAPRISGPRELIRLVGLPMLGAVPRSRFRHGRSPTASEREAYQALQAAVQLRLQGEGQQMVLVTSALYEEGKTEVTAQLGRGLAQAGERTLLVSADLRRPLLHKLLRVERAPGFSDILVAARRDGGDTPAELISSLTATAGVEDGPAVLASGNRPPNPSGLLASKALDRVFEEIGRTDYRYVIIDGPPLLGLIDGQALAERVRNVIVVSRIDRATPENLLDLRELLHGLRINVLGVVVIGAEARTYR
jgi:capsular exopolysaccharide synthesis family protein